MPHVNITIPVETLNLALFGLAKLAESAQQAGEVLRVAGTRSIEEQQRSEEARSRAGAAPAGAPAGVPAGAAYIAHADSEGGEQ